MDPYAVNMMSCTSMVTHIFLLHASVVVHMEDSYSEFHSTTVCSHKLLQFLPTIASWAEFRARYHDFMTIGAQRWDGSRYQL